MSVGDSEETGVLKENWSPITVLNDPDHHGRMAKEPSLKSWRECLGCSYCKEELTSPPMLMGRNCHHVICVSCKEGLFPNESQPFDGNKRNVPRTCPVCDCLIERNNHPNESTNFFEILKCVRDVVISFDELVAAAKQDSVDNSTIRPGEATVGRPPSPLSLSMSKANETSKQIDIMDPKPASTPARKRRGRPPKSAGTVRTVASISATKTPLVSSVPKRPAAVHSKLPTPHRAKDLEKRNAKGETLLHAAVIKNRLEDVKSYLAAGASPNVKDFAGWTPLHEACSHGFGEMVDLLLKAGAIVDVPGGEFNETPLHDAVAGRRTDIVSLLVAHGADPMLSNSAGLNACDVAAGDTSLLEILKSGFQPKDKEKLSAEKVFASSFVDPVLAYCALSADNVRHLVKICKERYWKKPTDEVNRETNLLITECIEVDGLRVAPLNCHTLRAAVMGKPIVDYECFVTSKALTDSSPEGPSLLDLKFVDAWMADDVVDLGAREGLVRSRENAAKMLPPLFDGFHVFVVGGVEFDADDFYGLTKQDVVRVLAAAGANILHREPDPSKLDRSALKLPFHAANGPVANTSHIIMYPPSKKPNICYNMAELKALPLAWLKACIAEFCILDPTPFVAAVN